MPAKPQESPVAACLVEILLGQRERAVVAAERLAETGRWNEAVLMARRWKVAPNLGERIRTLELQVPLTEAIVLRKDAMRAYARAAFFVSAGIRAIQALEESRIPVVAFKGAASMAYLYGGPEHRSTQDVDLLISPDCLSQALACLKSCDFISEGGPVEEYLHFIENGPAFAGNQAATLIGPGGSEIDLHWDLKGSGLVAAEILSRAQRAPLMGASIPVVDPIDCFLLTVHHSIRENLSVESVIRDLMDLRLWFFRFADTGELGAVAERAAASGALAAVLAIVRILESGGARVPPATAFEALSTPDEVRSAGYLAELFDYQLNVGRLNTDLVHLVHAGPWRQILRGLRTGWSEYRQTMRTLEQRRGGELPLSLRAAKFAQSIPGARGLKLARELARIKYRATN